MEGLKIEGVPPLLLRTDILHSNAANCVHLSATHMGNQVNAIFQKPEPKRPEIHKGQHFVHVTLRRQMDSAIKALQVGAQGKNTWSVVALNGFLYHVLTLLHDHHYHEEEMVFPVVIKNIPALKPPLENFQNEHKQLVAIIEQLQVLHKVGQPLDVAQMQKAEQLWTSVRALLLPHFQNEEDIITEEQYNTLPIADAQTMIDRIMAHAQSGEGANIRLSIMWYSLEPKERPVMFEKLPFIVSDILIPWVWYNSWKDFIPFFPCYEFGQNTPPPPPARANIPPTSGASSSARGGLDIASSVNPLDLIAEAIVARKTDGLDFSPDQVTMWLGNFENLMLTRTAIEALTAFANTKGQTLERIPDDKLSQLPDSVPRPRGAADFFTLTDAGKKFYVVVADGTPYVSIVPV